MTLTYIHHSGFALETESFIMVFDYWMDPAGIMPTLCDKGKHIYVFSSHFHEDHFTREIFSWKDQYPSTNFTYLLSKDILSPHCGQPQTKCDNNMRPSASASPQPSA